ncbi:ribosomal large subunit pseudouridine synthase D [Hydrogenispora ethanolica]|jgi:23S rRNA pseudouridine1911/1915/1917 synthase|uniref:Pseudouridine synthase n=1 Tax=Hydrogenispora ethanolica TaxID=1082276 RepID=A0A4R1R5U5_HYDET|nr:RluA family pseudouridine synthase [Hydrogenispora ethanolica]TCL60903.1 ribosomal large subunit pseudouridine synthase D [Hydrogenispora ethanolica]
MQLQKLKVDDQASGLRLDVFLSNSGLWPSRSFVQKLIAAGGATRNGKPLKASYKIEPGDELEIVWEEPQPLEVVAEAIPLDILYEDPDLVVVNKPRGMVVHPAAGNQRGTLVNALLEHCEDLSGIGGVIRPGIVHRLDKDTSGVLVVAKNDYSHLALARQIKERSMKRMYKALVHGRPPEQGRIEAPIGRHPVERKKMAVVPGGRFAATNYRVLEYLGVYAYLEARLETGRTHQIRVHFSHLGYPLVGDPVYGYRKEAVPIQGQALHAALLGFNHPRDGRYLEFATEPPPAMQTALDWCRKQRREA